ncbi:MAG: methyltransferase domain-containing protein [Myxococcota bacterium]
MPSLRVVQRAFKGISRFYDAAPLQAWVYHPAHDVVRDAIRASAGGHRLPLVVDVGVGTGESLRWLPDVAERVVGVDLSWDMLSRAREKRAARTWLVRASGTALPLSSGTADVVMSCYSMHWWPDVGEGWRELRRVVRPGGMVLVVVPAVTTHFPLPLRPLVKRAVSRFIMHAMSADEYAALATAAGLDVQTLQRLQPIGWLVHARRPAVSSS